MGDLTTLELKNEVRAGLAGRTDLDPRLLTFINLGQQRLARMDDFEEMRILSESVLTYTGTEDDRFLRLPTIRECYSILLLDGANSRKLGGRTHTYMDMLAAKPDYFARTWPSLYCLWNNTIEVYPLPRQQFTIRLRWSQWPAPLVEDTERSQFLQKDEIIIELALCYANYGLGKEETALKHEARAKRLLDESIEVDVAKPDMNILPIPASGALQASEPWNNPFVKET